jgi:hypothetical protein
MNFFKTFFLLFIFRSRFEVCMQQFGGFRPAGLGVKGIRTNSSKRLSQIIIYSLIATLRYATLRYTVGEMTVFAPD